MQNLQIAGIHLPFLGGISKKLKYNLVFCSICTTFAPVFKKLDKSLLINVGTSATYDTYGLCVQNSILDYSDGSDFAKCYGNNAGDDLKADWGALPIENGGGKTWRTLTQSEWIWLLGTDLVDPNPGTNCRTSSTVGGTANGRFAKATVAEKTGVIIFPDSYTHPSGVTAPASVNDKAAAFTANTYDATAWGQMEAAGCVFLPAAGYRAGMTITDAGAGGYYWSSTNTGDQYTVRNGGFTTSVLNFDNSLYYRYGGESVRLVLDVVE